MIERQAETEAKKSVMKPVESHSDKVSANKSAPQAKEKEQENVVKLPPIPIMPHVHIEPPSAEENQQVQVIQIRKYEGLPFNDEQAKSEGTDKQPLSEHQPGADNTTANEVEDQTPGETEGQDDIPTGTEDEDPLDFHPRYKDEDLGTRWIDSKWSRFSFVFDHVVSQSPRRNADW